MAESDRLIDKFLALRGQLARLVMSIVPPKEVEDIVQETYVRVCQVENRDHIRDPRAYLFRTARNLALDHVKRSESRLTVSADIDALPEEALLSPPESDPTHAQVASDEEFALFCEAVRSLPRQCRRAFVLKKVYGYTLKEIMAEMDLGRAHGRDAHRQRHEEVRAVPAGTASGACTPRGTPFEGYEPTSGEGTTGRRMSKVVPISRDDELLEAASRWVLKIDEGPLSAGEEAALAAWLDEHGRHCELLVEAAAVWDKTDALARSGRAFSARLRNRSDAAPPLASAVTSGRCCRGAGGVGARWSVADESRWRPSAVNDVGRIRDRGRRAEDGAASRCQRGGVEH